MSERIQTADLALPYQEIPRPNQRFIMKPGSHLDIMLPSTSTERSRLRLHDVNQRWVRVIDLSAYPFRIPDDDSIFDAPYGSFDVMELDEEIVIGRDHNPDALPILNKNVVSREHFGLTVSLGHCGIILAVRDLNSHNGTEIVSNASVASHETDSIFALRT